MACTENLKSGKRERAGIFCEPNSEYEQKKIIFDKTRYLLTISSYKCISLISTIIEKMLQWPVRYSAH